MTWVVWVITIALLIYVAWGIYKLIRWIIRKVKNKKTSAAGKQEEEE